MDDLTYFRKSVRGEPHKITNDVIVRFPTLSEICEIGETKYYQTASLLTANSSMYKTFLWDMGIDWTTVSDYEFFLMMTKSLPIESTRPLLGDLDLSVLVHEVNEQTGETVLSNGINQKKSGMSDFLNENMEDIINTIQSMGIDLENPESADIVKELLIKLAMEKGIGVGNNINTDDNPQKVSLEKSRLSSDTENSDTEKTDEQERTDETELEPEQEQHRVIIDRAIYTEMVTIIRTAHGFENKTDNPGNEHTKKHMVEKDRKRIKRLQNKKDDIKSGLKPLIASLVNHANFKYDYTTVWDLPICAFTESLRRVQKYMHHIQVMNGVYAGTIDLKKMNKDELDWLK